MPEPNVAQATPASNSASKWHRSPAVPRRLNNINPETDIRVRLLCRVIDRTVGGDIVEDAPAQPLSSVPAPQMEVMLEPDIAAALKPDDVIRVLARVLPLQNGFELRGELIQDMSKLDMDLYGKVFKMDQ